MCDEFPSSTSRTILYCSKIRLPTQYLSQDNSCHREWQLEKDEALRRGNMENESNNNFLWHFIRSLQVLHLTNAKTLLSCTMSN